MNYYRTKDDRFLSPAFLQSDRYWPEFCVLIDRIGWLADGRLTDAAACDRHRVEQDDNGKVVLVPAPAQFDRIVPTLGRAPGHGAHTDEVLEREGLDVETIADLPKRGVVR